MFPFLGESGTGKEVVAQAIYHHSSRANGLFQANQLRHDPGCTSGKWKFSGTKKARSPTRIDSESASLNKPIRERLS
ncbi:MAG: sigma 54-interacting transcriptional regulator [Pirellulaceae bacterium]